MPSNSAIAFLTKDCNFRSHILRGNKAKPLSAKRGRWHASRRARVFTSTAQSASLRSACAAGYDRRTAYFGVRRAHPQTQLQSALQHHARQPFGAARERPGQEPRLLCRSDRPDRQRRRQRYDLSARRCRGLPSLAGAQARDRAAGRAGRHALLHRGGFGKGKILFREGRLAGAMGRAAVPGPHARMSAIRSACRSNSAPP